MCDAGSHEDSGGDDVKLLFCPWFVMGMDILEIFEVIEIVFDTALTDFCNM